MDKCGVLASLSLWVCVFFFCPSLHVSTRQLEPWPPVGLAGLPPVKAWEPSEEKKKTGLYSTRTWFSSLRHTHVSIGVLTRWRLRGSPPHSLTSEACWTLTPLIIFPDAEVWAGVITSEPWLLTQRSGLDHARIILPGFSQVRHREKQRQQAFRMRQHFGYAPRDENVLKPTPRRSCSWCLCAVYSPAGPVAWSSLNVAPLEASVCKLAKVSPELQPVPLELHGVYPKIVQ